jgi:predicted SAM-dependent methyltransferase
MNNIREFVKLGLDRDINEFYSSDDLSGIVLNVGCGNKKIKDAISIDYPEWDADKDFLPVLSDSVKEIHCYHVLEHLASPVNLLQDFQRVLVKGGVVNILVPYYTSQMAYHDLDHKHRFCEETWRVLFGNPYYDKNKIVWKFRVHTNFIFGIVERNLALFTQLVKE